MQVIISQKRLVGLLVMSALTWLLIAGPGRSFSAIVDPRISDVSIALLP